MAPSRGATAVTSSPIIEGKYAGVDGSSLLLVCLTPISDTPDTSLESSRAGRLEDGGARRYDTDGKQDRPNGI
jgi:hypothetical protein